MAEKSPIIIPDQYRNRGDQCAKFGIVMAVGEIDDDPHYISARGNVTTAKRWTLEVGDSIMFHIHEGVHLKLDGDEYFVIDTDAVLGKINLT